MENVEQLPIYEPEFKVGTEHRMAMLHVPEGKLTRGGLAIVWGGGKITKNDIMTRRPAVMKLPNIWTHHVKVYWRGRPDDFPADEFDVLWCMEREKCWLEQPRIHAMGGSWLPAKTNILLELLKSKNSLAQALGTNLLQRAHALCAEHGVTPMTWLPEFSGACKRCGGTGNIGFLSTVRCPSCGGRG